MNLSHLSGKFCSPVAAADFFKTCSPGSGGYGEAKVLERLFDCPNLQMGYGHKFASSK